MTPEDILKHPARVLTQAQRECYFEHGYVGVESIVPKDVLAELQAVTADFLTKAATKLNPAMCLTSAPAIRLQTPCCAA